MGSVALSCTASAQDATGYAIRAVLCVESISPTIRPLLSRVLRLFTVEGVGAGRRDLCQLQITRVTRHPFPTRDFTTDAPMPHPQATTGPAYASGEWCGTPHVVPTVCWVFTPSKCIIYNISIYLAISIFFLDATFIRAGVAKHWIRDARTFHCPGLGQSSGSRRVHRRCMWRRSSGAHQ